MIRIGTLCMVVGAVLFPEDNGRTCTTISPLTYDRDGDAGYYVCYPDETSDLWIARCLFPLAPPTSDTQTARDKALEMV